MADDTDARAREMAREAMVAGVVVDGVHWTFEHAVRNATEALLVSIAAPLLAARAQAERERDEALCDRDAWKATAHLADDRANTAEARAAALRKALENDWAEALYNVLLADYREHNPLTGEVVTSDIRPHFTALCEFIAARKEALAADQAGGEEAAPAQPYVSPYRKRNSDPEMIEWRRDASPPQPATAGGVPEAYLAIEYALEIEDHYERQDFLLAVQDGSDKTDPEWSGWRARLAAAPSPAPDGRVRELEEGLKQIAGGHIPGMASLAISGEWRAIVKMMQTTARALLPKDSSDGR